MAAKALPWPPLISLLAFLSFILISSSLSQSSSFPQNIQTFYPIIPPPPPPPPSPPQTKHIPPRQNVNTHHPSSTYRKVVKAVLATATGTAVVSALFFFVLIKYTNNKKQKHSKPNTDDPCRDLRREPREDFTKANGVLVDEYGLEMHNCKRLKGGKIRSAFNKHLNCNNFDKDDERRRNRKNSFLRVQERPLLSEGETVASPSPAPAVDKKIESTTIPLPPSAPPRPPKIPTPPPPIPTKGPADLFKPLPLAQSSSGTENGQVRMKPLHWDKVNPHNVEHSMVWHGIEKGSFKVDHDQMEALFGDRKSPKQFSSSPAIEKSSQSSQIFILDPRKSQNIAIIVRSLAVSRGEISDSLVDGHGLNVETLERLTRIALTQEEETSILEFNGDPEKLAEAESFLHHILKSVPTAFPRLNAMLFRSNYEPETLYLKESLQILEQACNDLKTRRIFLKLLEAILKAGNRMNAGTTRGNAQAFNLTALRKLSDVKGSDGKTTLLHFIVEQVVRAEGKRCLINRSRSLNRTSSNNDYSSISDLDKEKEYIIMGLPVVGGLSAELGSVKKAATIEFDGLAKTCPALKSRLNEIRQIVMKNENNEMDEDGFRNEMRSFLESAEEELRGLKKEQEKVMEIVKKTTDYYHGNEGNKNPLQLFVVIRDFLGMVDQTCIDITRNMQKRRRRSEANDAGESSSLARRTVQFPQLPPNFMSDNLNDSSESDDDGEDLREQLA